MAVGTGTRHARGMRRALVGRTVAGALTLAVWSLVPTDGSAEEPAATPEVAVVWIASREACPVDPPAVFAEVTRIFRAVPLRIAWREEPPESQSPGGEVRVIGLRNDPARRARPPLGITLRGVSDTTWVLCSQVSRAIGTPAGTRSARLDVAVGRVVAHELVHVVFASLPHAVRGLMAPVVDATVLTRPELELDGGVRHALRRRLEKAAARPHRTLRVARQE
jgi:hypothetical protein